MERRKGAGEGDLGYCNASVKLPADTVHHVGPESCV